MFFTSVNDHFKVFSMKLEIFQNIRLLFIYYLQPKHFTPKSDITGLSRESPHCKAQHGKAKLFKKIRKGKFQVQNKSRKKSVLVTCASSPSFLLFSKFPELLANWSHNGVHTFPGETLNFNRNTSSFQIHFCVNSIS